MVAREVYGCDHVRHVRTSRDQPRTLRNHRVEDFAGIVVARVGRLDDASAKACAISHQIVVAEHVVLLGAFLIFTVSVRPTTDYPQD
jgi:hypothetical protein